MTKTPQEILVAEEEDLNVRLDKLLTARFPSCSRTYFQSLIEKGSVLINGTPSKKREKLKLGDEVEICFELTPEITLEAEDIPLDILFEDDDILVVNKPAGMVVHPAPGHPRGTFVNALLFHCKELEKQMEDPLRPGIVHRLDKDTSGALVAAKTSFAHRALVGLFSQRQVQKTYKAICIGTPKALKIEEPIKRHPTKRQEMAVCEGGKPATTLLKVLSTKDGLSLIDVELITGRTHQIRVHLKHIDCPILGDYTYGRPPTNVKWGVKRQLLHAETISFIHPRTGNEVSITAPIPPDMQNFIDQNL
jgi:23S rRNA pseudouridine1911/1915/1917 synthase